MKKLFLVSMGLCYITIGCGLDQDPLKSSNRKLKDSRPVEEPVAKPLPMRSDGLTIQAEDFLSFKEGAAASFEIKPRLLVTGFRQPEIKIVNPQAFPGIEYNSTTSLLTWTPPADFVQDDFYTSRILELSVFADSVDPLGVPLANFKKIRLDVTRVNETSPKLLTVSTPITSIEEGETGLYCARFEDTDSIDQADKRPRIEILSSTNGINMAPFARLTSLSWNQFSKAWEFCLRVNSTDVELTSDKSAAEIKFRIISRFQALSPTYDIKFDVINKMSEVVSNWVLNQEIPVLIESKINFFIYDPKMEGVVSLAAVKIPSGATLVCENKSRNYLLTCELSIKPDLNMAEQVVTFSTNVRNENAKVPGRSKMSYLNYAFKIGKAPSSPPAQENL